MSEVVRHFNVSVNNLIADFSYLESTTLSRLFTSYCMNMYGSQLFRYNDRKTIDLLYVAWRKSIRKIWKISPRTHCSLLSHINNCDPIENVMERRCIKFIWNLLNSNCKLFDQIVKHSLSMSSTTLGENIRYFMYKYGICMNDWNKLNSVLNHRIQSHALKETSIGALELPFEIFATPGIAMYIYC